MEIGLQITESEYRKLPYPSYSLLSSLAKDGPVTMTGVKLDISELDSIIIGSITDSLVTEGGPPDNMVVIDKKPSGKALLIIKELAERKDLVDKYLLSVKNKQQIKEECDKLEYYKSLSVEETIKKLKKYNKYVKALSDFGEDAMIVSSYQWYEANTLSTALFSKFNILSSPDIIGQVKLIGKVKGVEIKGMLDFIHIDHENKTVTPYDLKTGIGKHDTFFETGFIRWKYYLQSSLYKELLQDELKKTPLKDYQVENFKFMFCGRTDKLPIIYRVTNKWHSAGLRGFTLQGIEYSGVYELLEEYKYYIENPNALYRRGYDIEEIDFKDNLCNVNEYGK